MFQFTHPGKGATDREVCITFRLIVSIHAPWEGCDYERSLCPSGTSCFNSRTLGRVRPTSDIAEVAHREFQFTHPGKGATYASITGSPMTNVSIHAPWEGCDRGSRCASRGRLCFNSRTLGRVRLPVMVRRLEHREFQFTHPGKGATDWLLSYRRS